MVVACLATRRSLDSRADLRLPTARAAHRSLLRQLCFSNFKVLRRVTLVTLRRYSLNHNAELVVVDAVSLTPGQLWWTGLA